MSLYGYEYFCGANVVVEVEGFPVLETAGISYSIQEGKMPLYGYSSRRFDAVARGQVIVQGSLLINYVHQDYLYRAISAGIANNRGAGPTIPTATDTYENQLGNVLEASRVAQETLINYPENIGLAEAFKDKFWRQDTTSTPSSVSSNPNAHDSFGSLDIRITFGERIATEGNVGDTGLILQGVYFTGRSLPIQISEQVLVEEYQFFARDVRSLQLAYGLNDIVPPAQENLRDAQLTKSLTSGLPQGTGVTTPFFPRSRPSSTGGSQG